MRVYLYVTTLVVGTTVIGGGQGEQRCTITISYSDPRGDQFLRRKAKQLPTDSPGLVMVDVGRAIGAGSGWEGLLAERFGRGLHTRVSGVCLFETFTMFSLGLTWGLAASYLPNDGARMQSPDWLVASLRRWPTMPEVMAGRVTSMEPHPDEGDGTLDAGSTSPRTTSERFAKDALTE